MNAAPQWFQGWRAEFNSGRTFRDFHAIQSDALAQVERWPRELAQPVHAMVARVADAMPRPIAALHPLQAVRHEVEKLAGALAGLKLEKVTGDAELCELAETGARLCEQYADAAAWIVKRMGLEPPEGRTSGPDGPCCSLEGRLLRMQCTRWWRRNLRRHYGQAVENAMRARGLVRKGRAAYCTDWALTRRQTQKARQRATLQEAIAENEAGEQFSLSELAEGSLSNPAVRRAEFMTRIRGFEEIAEECGHVGLFVTGTAPSAFHPQLHAGAANPRYNGEPVRGAQGWLRKIWARVRAMLDKLSIRFYGFRIAEPHHDGTPHWHLLVFLPASQLGKQVEGWKQGNVRRWETGSFRDVLYRWWCSEYREELTSQRAIDARILFKRIDKHKGSAAGYVAKYVAKNIDGFKVGDDYEAGGLADSTAHRVEAWASTHRIRQFQQIGGPAVGLWRELWRIREVVDDEQIERARLAVEAQSWASMVREVGGIAAGRCTSVRVWKENLGTVSSYGDVQGPVPAGVVRGSVHVRSRHHVWRVLWSRKSGCSRQASRSAFPGLNSGAQRAPSSLGPVSITVRGDGLIVIRRPWCRPIPAGITRIRCDMHMWKPPLRWQSWFVHQAISVAAPIRPPPRPSRFDFIHKVTYDKALSWAT